MRVFTAWGKDGVAHTLVPGDDVPRFANGHPQPDCEDLIYKIEASNWEEASAIYHLRQGWEPFQPILPAQPCPQCGALYYPMGSGQCWRCDFHN